MFFAPLDVVITEFDIVEPDLLYMSRERATQVLVPEHIRGVPELVVEVASEGTRTRDEAIKRALYERSGVSEYWVVDPEIDVVRVPEGRGQVRAPRRAAARCRRHTDDKPLAGTRDLNRGDFRTVTMA